MGKNDQNIARNMIGTESGRVNSQVGGLNTQLGNERNALLRLTTASLVQSGVAILASLIAYWWIEPGSN